MEYSENVSNMCTVCKCRNHGPSAIPQEGQWTKCFDIKNINGFSHGIGWCAPQQGACKLTLNVKNGIIEETLIETVGCSGMTHSAAMAAEILPGNTIIEALNQDLVCDSINVAMREIFKQFIYGRTQTAFTKNGLPIGSGLEDLGKELRSQVGTMYSTKEKGVRYLEIAEGYITRLALDENSEIIGYEFLRVGDMLKKIKNSVDIEIAYKESMGKYGRFDEAVKCIDPRSE
ncbi:MAG: hypothetical protein LBF33_01585 [Oscillospiraceae bacterium]|jgi:NifU-like protein involved in Fe-S cluster formation|nr:hypothetical protein [Oscillospiraceae bacterium]